MEIIKIVQDGIELDVNNGDINASSITQDTNNRFVTDVEKTAWNNKQDSLTAGTNVAITGTTISATDTVYDDTELTTRIIAVENREDKDTTYNVATTSSNGLMSSADKSKLDGVEVGAQKNAVTSVNGQTGAVATPDTKYTAGTNVTINASNVISATDTTYGLASASGNGLMSSAMFSKLNAMPDDSVMRIIVLTQAGYDALSTAEKGRADTVYFTNG